VFPQRGGAASTLNHSNICTIHENGKNVGNSFIAVEYLDGSTPGTA
jgi:hypothetical protein